MANYLFPRKKHTVSKKIAFVVLIILVFFTGFLAGGILNATEIITINESVIIPQYQTIYMEPEDNQVLIATNQSSYVAIRIPAVDDQGNGVSTFLTVQAIPGTGRVLTNIDKLLFWVDTQNSIRRATTVAQDITGIDLLEFDIIYSIKANATVIGGPSAGAAITIATIAVLLNKSVNNSVMVTGSVNHDGTVGPVGGIFEKAVASKEMGAELFLVPLTQATSVTYKTREYCEKIGWMDFCSTETYPVKLDIEKDAKIKVIEIMEIEDALEYILMEH